MSEVHKSKYEENQPLNKEQIPLADLEEIFNQNQKRSKCEEVDFLSSKGGLNWLFQGLLTTPEIGIGDDLEERIRVYGSNKRVPRPPKGYCELLCNALEDFTLRVLLVASICSIGFIATIEVGTADASHRSTAWIEGFAIFLAVFVCSNVAASNDYSKEKQFQKLNQVSDKDKIVTVIRNKEPKRMHEQEVVTGDIIKLIEGMEIPADGILIEASEVLIDESSMTGETNSIKKTTLDKCLKAKHDLEAEGRQLTEQDRHEIPSPALLSGTRVLEGEGLFICCVVGDSSCVGKIRAALEQEDNEQTPLQEKLTDIAEDIGKFGLFAAIAIVFVLLIRLAIERGIDNSWDHSKHWNEIINFLIIGIVVLAVAIPEGLPLSVTLSLAYSVQKMMADKNLVRKMYACEVMGGADSICSDKTGTLTMNKMYLTQIWNEKLYDIETHAQKQNLRDLVIKENEQLFIESICCNSSAELFPDQTGSKTEIATLEYIQKTEVKYQEVRKQCKFIQKMPFNSARKRMSVIIQLQNGKRRLYIKGASEIIVKGLVKFHNFQNASPTPLDSEHKTRISQAITQMARMALRTICVAYRDLDGSEDITKQDNKIFQVESENLVFLAILGIQDTLRPGVKDAVTKLQHAGITIRMVTGDNMETARAIAVQCGIINEGDANALVMEGPEFVSQIGGVVCKNCKIPKCDCARTSKDAEKRKVPLRVDTIADQDKFKYLYPKIAVLARSRPQDKYAMIVGLKEKEHVVAVTGDGTNDAPALKKADVGFAMGIAGTQVAKDAAAIILMEDNFTDIVKAVMWGRNIFQSIRKFLQFQLTVNVVAVFMTLIAAVVVKQEVLRPIQMLWINLIMDSFASLALATEPPSEALLQEKPYGRNSYIITKKMFKHIIGQSIFQFTVMMILVFVGEEFLPEWKDSFDDESDFKDWYKYNMHYYPEVLIVRSGRLRSVDGRSPDYESVWDAKRIPSRHYTYIFNVFVMMQFFNFFNARKLMDEINIFEKILNNSLFAIIVVFIFCLQIIIVTFGSIAFSCYSYYGLNVQQWLICIGIGIVSWLVSVILKLLPEEKICPQYGKSEEPPEQPGEQQQPGQNNPVKKQSSRVLELRRGSSKKMSQNYNNNNNQKMHYQASIKE